MTRPPRWTAAGDAVAHAHRPGAMRTACGLEGIAERFAHPIRVRCPGCIAILEPPATVACRAYLSHQSAHHRVGSRFVCTTCHPPAAPLAPAL